MLERARGWAKAAKEGGQQLFGSLAQLVVSYDASSDPDFSLTLTTWQAAHKFL